MMNESGRGLEFRIDKPAETDDFGVHERIARAIAEVVREQPRVKMIGLLGGWGSGKSTVVQLVRGALSSPDANSDVRCFVYDTWLRQNEPPRRAFLEALLTFLERPDATAEAKLEKQLEKDLAELKGQLEIIDTETESTLTGPGKAMVLLVAALPIGLKLIGDGTITVDFLREFWFWPLYRFWPPVLFWLGWILTVAPFSVAACVVLGKRKTLGEIAGVFASRPGEKKRETRTRRLEPSAIEFQAMFRKILRTSGANPRQLLIVIDNLDRLPPEDAMSLWATMRGFFLDAREHKTDEPDVDDGSLPTVLVPIDPDAPGRIHGDGPKLAERAAAAPVPGTDEPAPVAPDKAKGLSQAFVDKTFDLVFHVPPPVLSGWQRYLEERLKSVMGSELETGAALDVRVIYEGFHRLKGGDAKVTPRDLNTFVNSVAALWMQHRGGDIRLAIMAHFVCDRRRLTHDLHATLAETADLTDYDRDWRRGLAALAFGVDKARADELYMKDPIRKAIEDNNGERLKELSSEPGFDIYFDQVAGDGAVSSLAIARVLSASGLEADWVGRIWRRLRESAPRQLNVHPFAAGDDEGLANLAETGPPEERAAFVTAMSMSIGAADPSRLMQHYGRYTAAVAWRLVELAEGVGLTSFQVALPGHEKVFAHVIGHDLPDKVRRALTAQQSRDVSVGDAAAMSGGRELEPALLGLRALAWFAQTRWQSQAWGDAVEAVGNVLKGSDAERLNLAALALVAMHHHVPQAKDRVQSLHSEGVLLGGLQRILAAPEAVETDPGAAALIAFSFQVGSSPEPPPDLSWLALAEQRPSLARHVDLALRDLSGDDTMEALRGLLSNNPRQAELIRAVAAARYPRSDFETLAHAALQNVSGYLDLLEEVDEFWRRLPPRSGFWETIRNMDLQMATPLYARLIRALDNRSALAKHLQARLNSLDSSQWIVALQARDDPMPLVEALDALPQSRITIGAELSKVLEEALDPLTREADGGRRARWFNLVRWTKPPIRSRLLDKLCVALVADAVSDPLQLLAAGGALLAGPEGLGSLPLAGAVLVPKLLATDEGVDWLLAQAPRVADWIQHAAGVDQEKILGELQAVRVRRPEDAEDLLVSWFPQRRVAGIGRT